MTVDTRAGRAATASAPSVHVVRARQLLLAGLAGGLAATAAMLVVFGVLDGTLPVKTIAEEVYGALRVRS